MKYPLTYKGELIGYFELISEIKPEDVQALRDQWNKMLEESPLIIKTPIIEEESNAKEE